MKTRALLMVIGLGWAASLMAQPQASYYTASTLDGKSGQALELALQAIIYPHTHLGYGDLWEAYETTDLAPADSIPASHAGSYSMLVYDMYAWMAHFPKFYEEADVNKAAAHSQTGGINREHCVPNSWWGAEAGNRYAYTDLHHLVPSDGAANNAKQNYPLGYYQSGLTLSWPTETKTYQGKAYVTAENACSHVWDVPTSLRSNYGGASKVFEPADQYKGDFARMYLYVVCAYEKKLRWQTSENTMFTGDSATHTTIAPWAKQMLLAWHRADPVSEKERLRNNDVETLQGNRNPFIDYPILAEYIWGDSVGKAFSLAKATLSYTSSYYDITKAAMTGGTVAITPSSAQAGQTVSLTATPDRTHLFQNIAANWIVRDQNNQPVAVTLGAGNSCTFTMPAANVTVSATFSANPYAEHIIFEEDFSSASSGNNTSNSGSNTAWAGNAQVSVTGSVFQAGGAVRISANKTDGAITTKQLDLSQNGGRFVLAFDVKGWSTVRGPITVSITGQETQTFTYTATMDAEEFQTIRFLYTGGQANSTITFSSTAGKQVFIDNIRVYYFTGMCSISIGSAEWGTYYTDDTFLMPDGVTGYTALYAGDELTLTPTYPAGSIVPASTALLVHGNAGTYPYYLRQSTTEAPATALYGNAVDDITPQIFGATHYYKLAQGELGLGWYWGAEDGGVFELAAHKAYLALPAGANAPAHFGMPASGQDATSLTTTDKSAIDWAQPVYNILGQPVNAGSKGILIQNGTKYVVR